MKYYLQHNGQGAGSGFSADNIAGNGQISKNGILFESQITCFVENQKLNNYAKRKYPGTDRKYLSHH